jgi:hypothetical protein
MQAIPLLGRRPRPADLLLVAAVLIVAVAVVRNGIIEYRDNHGTKRDLANFKRFLDSSVGRAGFGNPRVKLGRKIDSVCATHRAPDYRLCAQLDSKTGKTLRAYKYVSTPGGGTRRVKVSPGPTGSASAAPRSTRTG